MGCVSLAGHATEMLACLWHLETAQVVTTDAEGHVCLWKPSEGVIKHRHVHLLEPPACKAVAAGACTGGDHRRRGTRVPVLCQSSLDSRRPVHGLTCSAGAQAKRQGAQIQFHGCGGQPEPASPCIDRAGRLRAAADPAGTPQCWSKTHCSLTRTAADAVLL